MKAQNIFLDENTGGKGRYFKSRFLQPGLVKYSFGVCVLDKATIDKFIQGFVGCPVIIGHKDVTNASAKDDRVGVISRIWYDETDGWFWGEGIIFDEKAISLVESGYNVSCQYDITEYSNNTTKALHNGNPYDKVILNGKPEHLAIVENPRYENAMIAVNAMEWAEEDMIAENEEHWITIGAGEDTKGRHILVKDGETNKEATERKIKEWKSKESGDKKDSKENNGYYKNTSYEVMPSGAVRKIEYNEGYDAWGNGDARHTFLSKEEYEKETGKKYEDLKSDKSDSSDSGKQAPKKINYNLNKSDVNKMFGGMADTGEYYTNGDFAIDKNYVNLRGQESTKHEEINNSVKRILGESKEHQSQKKYRTIKNFEEGELKYKYRRKPTKVAKYTYKDDDGETHEVYVNKKYNDLFKNFELRFGDEKSSIYAYDGKNLVGVVMPIDVISHKEDHTFTKAQNEEDDYTPNENQLSLDIKDKTAKNTIIQAINEIKENSMFKKLFNKKEKFTMEKDEMKALFIDCIQDVLKAQNEEDVEDVEFEEEEKAENKKCKNKKCKNEDVDKRKLIDEVAGIMKSAGCDDEVIRTAIAKMEKIGYDKSEADTADNAKKAKCEDEEDLEDAKNKAKNSIDELKGFLASAGVNKSASKYITKAQAIELGNELF